MVGAGGDAGVLIALANLSSIHRQRQEGHPRPPLDDGFIRLGATLFGVSMIMHFIYFPKEGGAGGMCTIYYVNVIQPSMRDCSEPFEIESDYCLQLETQKCSRASEPKLQQKIDQNI